MPGKYVRLYYGASYSGPWVCMDPGKAISNFSGYKFSNGESSYDNMASVGINTNVCTNPI